MANPPKTWGGAVSAVRGGEETLVAEHLQTALDVHRRVTDSAGAHLALLCENTLRTPWMAAKLLSKQRDLAQAAAKDLARHLAATSPVNRTPFRATPFYNARSLAKLG